MRSSAQIEKLEAEARYQRERLALYRARTHGSAPTSATRLRELERSSEFAERRLGQAKLKATTHEK